MVQTIVHPMRLRLLKDKVPELFRPGSLLNVGANRVRFELLDDLHRAGRRVTLLEIWPANVGRWKGDRRLEAVVRGDVRELDRLRSDPDSGLGSYEAVLWWHGPEHIEREGLPATLSQLERAAERLIVLGCPWGVYPQGEFMGNPHDAHRASLYPADFEALGYEVATIGQPDRPDGSIIAWKRIRPEDRPERIPHVVMVTHGDRLTYLERTIPALLKTTHPFTLTVVANEVSRASRKYLLSPEEGHSPPNLYLYKLITNRRNLGKPAAANTGWRTRPEAEYSVLLDDDMLALDRDWLRKLVDLADIPQIGIAGHSVEDHTFPLRVLRKPSGAARTVQIQPSGLGGACVMVPKRTVEKCGRYNEELPPYGESDALYGWKVRQAGLVCAYFDWSDLGRSFEHLGVDDDPAYRAWKNERRAEAQRARDELIRQYMAGRPLNK